MSTIQVTVGIDRLRFEPEAEFQTKTVDLLCQTAEAIWQFLSIDGIISKARRIVIALTEPAVIQHKQLTAQSLGLLCQLHQTGLIEIKTAALPTVIQHWANPLSPEPRNDMRVYIIMYPCRHAIESPIRPDQHRFRRFIAAAGLQYRTEIRRIDALHHPGQALQRPLGRGIVIAGPDEIDAVDRTMILSRSRLRQQEARLMPVGRKAGCAVMHHSGSTHGHRAAAVFRDPAAVKGGHLIFTGQIEAEAHELMDPHRIFSVVFQHGTAGQRHIKHRVIQLQPQTARVRQYHFQRLSAVGTLGQSAGHGNCPGMDHMVYINKIRCHSAVLAGQFHRTLPVVAPAAAAPFQRKHIQTGTVSLIIVHRGTPAKSGLTGKGRRILQPHRCTEMQLLQLPMSRHPKQIGELLRSQ